MGTRYGITKTRTKGHLTFTARGFIREYDYKVKVTAKTGTVVWIAAGCRAWANFDDALFHYDSRNMRKPPYSNTDKTRPGGNATDAFRWSDEDLLSYTRNPGLFGTSIYEMAAQRSEARAMLKALKNEVNIYWRKQKARRANERKRRA